MRQKTILLSLTALLMIGAGLFVWNHYTKKPFYVIYPEAVEKKKEKGKIKASIQYFNSLKTDLYTGKINSEDVMAVYSQLDELPSTRNKLGSWLNWLEMGPDNVGGRTRAIVIDKDNPKIIYAGGVSGGFWISKNGGATWVRGGNRDVNNINVSSMTQAADGTLYYGTGENGFTSGDGAGNSGFYGRGVYKSSDRGVTFTQLKSTDPTTPWAPHTWTNVHAMVSDPTNANRVYAGNDNGIWLTDDAGATWKKAVTIAGSYRLCTDLVISPDGSTIFASVGNANGDGEPLWSAYQLWRSTDRGATWARVGATGSVIIPTASSSFRVGISRSNPKTVYLSIALPNSQGSRFGAAYRSKDNGETWEVIGVGDTYFNPLAGQGFYDHALAVDPTNENRIIIGGLNMWQGKEVKGRFQWEQLTVWNQEFFGSFRNPYFVHADHHIYVFDNTTTPALYIGSDGGVSKSVDFTYADVPTFFNADYGYNTVQFYGIGVSHVNKNIVIGGTQDNGTILVNQGGITLLNSTDLNGGDGGFSEISLINPDVYFGEQQSGRIYRSFNAGRAWSNIFDDHIPAAGQGYPFITNIKLWESLNDPSSVDTVIFVDNNKAYKKGEKVSVKSRTGRFIEVTLENDLAAGAELKVQDVIQSKFFVGPYNGVWMTKEAVISG